MSDVAELARDRWESILHELGVDDQILNGKHQACPGCGGEDRFRFDNKDGRGDYYCNGCGAGDGFKLLNIIFGWDFATAAKEVENVLGVARRDGPRQPKDHSARLRHIQSELVAVTPGDPVTQYLKGRGLTSCPPTLKLHPSMRYYRDKENYVTYPAMIAKVVDNNGQPLGFYATYIKDGSKAPEKSPKKMLGEIGKNGSVVRLYKPVDGIIGVTEGIETALAAAKLFRLPTWAVLGTSGMAAFTPPPGIHTVHICMDNDDNYAGQAAAFNTAHRLTIAGLKVVLEIPRQPDTDFLDEYLSKK